MPAASGYTVETGIAGCAERRLTGMQSRSTRRTGGGNKYGNRKTTVYGITFDSEKEARRYLYLRALLCRGEIENLRLQEEFTLQNAFTTPSGERVKAIRYKADFWYTLVSDDLTRIPVIEDVKGFKTKEYQLKIKLMAAKGWLIT